ncbi:MAG: O-antigen ligase family protein [Anaerolineae bacterium]
MRTAVHDLIEATPLRWALHTRHRWLTVVVASLLLASLAVGGGWLIVEVGVIPMLALAVAVGYALWSLTNVEVAFWAVIGLVTLLPFGALPFDVGFTPTFLDLALGWLFFLWLMPLVLGGNGEALVLTPLGGPILVFVLMAVGSFVAGLSHAPLTSYLLRHFAEILMSIGFFFLIVNMVKDVGRLRRLTRVFLLAAGGAAALGIVLYVIPDEMAMRALSALGRVGYPTGAGVLRYIRDDPSLMQRATSTSVDPNILGSLLNLSLIIAIPQLFAERPVIKRVLLVPLIGVVGICLVLTVSRGSWVGAAVAVGVMGVLRYRKVLWLLGLAGLLFMMLPWTQEYVVHFVQGVQGEDLSTKMRFGEYKDSIILISRHPVLGVGFGGTPNIDTYLGVASVYLLIAEQMGLVGLTGFLVIVGTLLVRFWIRRERARAHADLEPLWYSYHGAVVGGLVGGVFDHYFFSLDFHHSVTIFWMILALATVTTALLDKRRLDSTPHV